MANSKSVSSTSTTATLSTSGRGFLLILLLLLQSFTTPSHAFAFQDKTTRKTSMMMMSREERGARRVQNAFCKHRSDCPKESDVCVECIKGKSEVCDESDGWCYCMSQEKADALLCEGSPSPAAEEEPPLAPAESEGHPTVYCKNDADCGFMSEALGPHKCDKSCGKDWCLCVPGSDEPSESPGSAVTSESPGAGGPEATKAAMKERFTQAGGLEAMKKQCNKYMKKLPKGAWEKIPKDRKVFILNVVNGCFKVLGRGGQ